MTGSTADSSVMLLARLRTSPSDSEAWSRFVSRYGPQIVAWCHRYGLQDADARDVAQDVLLQFYNQFERFQLDPTRRFRGYLRAITHGAWYAWLQRSQKRQTSVGGSEAIALIQMVPARDDLLAYLEREYDRELCQTAMEKVQARVEPHIWEAFRLLALEGVSGTEVAERLGIKRGTAFMARSRIQRMLRETIEQLDVDR